MRLKDVLGRVNTVAVEVDGIAEPLQARFRRPSTRELAEMQKAAKQAGDDEGAVDNVSALLANVLVGWGEKNEDTGEVTGVLEGDDGQPYPVTKDALADLPFDVLGAVAEAITGAFSPDPTKSSNSGSG